MESNSYLIEPNSQYRQELRLIMTESEISDLYQVLTEAREMNIPLPEVAKDLRAELWYMLTEVHEFNVYERLKGKP
jgi:hypothetical protein